LILHFSASEPPQKKPKTREKPRESAESSIRQTKNRAKKARKLQPEHWRNKTNEKRGKAEEKRWVGAGVVGK